MNRDLLLKLPQSIATSWKKEGLSRYFSLIVDITCGAFLVEFLSYTFVPRIYQWPAPMLYVVAALFSIVVSAPFIFFKGVSLGEGLFFRSSKRDLTLPERIAGIFFYFLRLFFPFWPSSLLLKKANRNVNYLIIVIIVSLYTVMKWQVRGSQELTFHHSFSLASDKSKSLKEEKLRLAFQRMRFVTHLDQKFLKHWQLTPHFDFFKKKGQLKISGALAINQAFQKAKRGTKREPVGILRRVKHLNLKSFVGSYFRQSPLLAIEYHHLDDGVKGQEPQWNLSAREEIETLIKTLLYDYALDDDTISMRKKFLKIFSVDQVSYFAFEKVGAVPFFFLSGIDDGTSKLLFFPLSEKKPFLYELTWNNGNNQQRDLFLSHFFSQVKWNFSEDTSFWGYPDDHQKMTLTHMIDMIMEAKLSKLHVKELEKYIYDYYFSNGRAMRQQVSDVNRVISLQKKKYSALFVAQWNNLYQAIKYNDEDFFKNRGEQ